MSEVTVQFNYPVTFTDETGVTIQCVGSFSQVSQDETFDTDCAGGIWTCGGGTTIDTGANTATIPSGDTLSQTIPALVAGNTYQVTINRTGATGGLEGNSLGGTSFNLGTTDGLNSVLVVAGSSDQDVSIATLGVETINTLLKVEEVAAAQKDFTITGVTGSGTEIATYSGTWDVDLVSGDKPVWSYDGTGDIKSSTSLTIDPTLDNSDGCTGDWACSNATITGGVATITQLGSIAQDSLTFDYPGEYTFWIKGSGLAGLLLGSGAGGSTDVELTGELQSFDVPSGNVDSKCQVLNFNVDPITIDYLEVVPLGDNPTRTLGEDSQNLVNCKDGKYGDLQEHLQSTMMALTRSKTGGSTTFQQFVLENNVNFVDPQVVRNPNLFMSAYDMSAMSVMRTGQPDERYPIMLVTDRLAIVSIHTITDTTPQVTFKKKDGTYQIVNVVSTTQYDTTDIGVVLFDAAVTDVDFFKIMPYDWQLDYAPQMVDGNGDMPFVVKHSNDQSHHPSWMAIGAIKEDTRTNVNLDTTQSYAPLIDWYDGPPAGGDSSGGNFYLINGEAIFIGATATTSRTEQVLPLITQLESIMDTLVPGSKFTQYDLSDFNLYR